MSSLTANDKIVLQRLAESMPLWEILAFLEYTYEEEINTLDKDEKMTINLKRKIVKEARKRAIEHMI